MKQELLRHFFAYLILCVGISVFVFLMFYSMHVPKIQRWVILGGSTFYFLWGVVSHVKTQSISKRVIYEYAAVSLLAALLLMLLTVG